MPYRNKTYIAFHADEDMHSYRLMTAWKASDGPFEDFQFHDAHEINNLKKSPHTSEAQIKRRLLERLKNTKVFVLLVGERTKTRHKYVRWEIEKALALDIPVIAINLNKKRTHDKERCPPTYETSWPFTLASTRRSLSMRSRTGPNHTGNSKGTALPPLANTQTRYTAG